MGDDVAAVSAVQCSVIQYCSDNVQPVQVFILLECHNTLPISNTLVVFTNANEPSFQIIESGSTSPGQNSENSGNSDVKVTSSYTVDVNNLGEEIICNSTPPVSESVEVNSEQPVEEVLVNNNTALEEIPEITEEKPNIDDLALKKECKQATNWSECGLKEECVKTEGDESELEAKKEEAINTWTDKEQARGLKREAELELRETVPKKRKKKAVVNGELEDPSPPPPLDEPEDEEEELTESESDEEVGKYTSDHKGRNKLKFGIVYIHSLTRNFG